ncbi:MAG: hypothetical protein AAB964_00395, partial [Patescibacteria group bacterium]
FLVVMNNSLSSEKTFANSSIAGGGGASTASLDLSGAFSIGTNVDETTGNNVTFKSMVIVVEK